MEATTAFETNNLDLVLKNFVLMYIRFVELIKLGGIETNNLDLV